MVVIRRWVNGQAVYSSVMPSAPRYFGEEPVSVAPSIKGSVKGAGGSASVQSKRLPAGSASQPGTVLYYRAKYGKIPRGSGFIPGTPFFTEEEWSAVKAQETQTTTQKTVVKPTVVQVIDKITGKTVEPTTTERKTVFVKPGEPIKALRGAVIDAPGASLIKDGIRYVAAESGGEPITSKQGAKDEKVLPTVQLQAQTLTPFQKEMAAFEGEVRYRGKGGLWAIPSALLEIAERTGEGVSKFGEGLASGDATSPSDRITRGFVGGFVGTAGEIIKPSTSIKTGLIVGEMFKRTPENPALNLGAVGTGAVIATTGTIKAFRENPPKALGETAALAGLIALGGAGEKAKFPKSPAKVKARTALLEEAAVEGEAGIISIGRTKTVAEIKTRGKTYVADVYSGYATPLTPGAALPEAVSAGRVRGVGVLKRSVAFDLTPKKVILSREIGAHTPITLEVSPFRQGSRVTELSLARMGKEGVALKRVKTTEQLEAVISREPVKMPKTFAELGLPGVTPAQYGFTPGFPAYKSVLPSVSRTISKTKTPTRIFSDYVVAERPVPAGVAEKIKQTTGLDAQRFDITAESYTLGRETPIAETKIDLFQAVKLTDDATPFLKTPRGAEKATVTFGETAEQAGQLGLYREKIALKTKQERVKVGFDIGEAATAAEGGGKSLFEQKLIGISKEKVTRQPRVSGNLGGELTQAIAKAEAAERGAIKGGLIGVSTRGASVLIPRLKLPTQEGAERALDITRERGKAKVSERGVSREKGLVSPGVRGGEITLTRLLPRSITRERTRPTPRLAPRGSLIPRTTTRGATRVISFNIPRTITRERQAGGTPGGAVTPPTNLFILPPGASGTLSLEPSRKAKKKKKRERGLKEGFLPIADLLSKTLTESRTGLPARQAKPSIRRQAFRESAGLRVPTRELAARLSLLTKKRKKRGKGKLY